MMKQKLSIGCLLMAAGSAKRFGENKLSAELCGKTLIERAMESIPREQFSRVLVVTQYPQIVQLAARFGYESLRNEHPEAGQSETIRLGTAALQKDCDAICYMVADQPLLRRESVAQEAAFYRAHPDRIVGLGHNGVRGNPCIFPARFYPELLALTGDTGGSRVIRAHEDALLLYEVDAAQLSDVDTRASLDALRQL